LKITFTSEKIFSSSTTTLEILQEHFNINIFLRFIFSVECKCFCRNYGDIINTMANRAISLVKSSRDDESETHLLTHAHHNDRRALWDIYCKFGREIPPSQSRRILLNYRGKECKPNKKHIQRIYKTCNSTISHRKFFWKFLLDSIEIQLTSSDHFHSQNDFYSHGSLCKQDEIIVLNDALTQLVRRTCSISYKTNKLSKRFAKTTSRFKLVFAVYRQKTFATNHVHQLQSCDTLKKEIRIHARGRLIVLKL
jgi:hypothetical protein